MRVSLAADVFTESTALTDILDLLRAFTSGHHDLLVAEPGIVSAATAYLNEHAPKLAHAYETLGGKGTVASAWTATPAQGPVLQITSATLADHSADLRRPAVFVVEDQESDGHFIKALCTVFRATRIQKALEEDWLRIEHGGGSAGVEKVAKVHAYHFRLFRRVAALLDSDRLLPGQQTKAHKQAARLASDGVVVHVLEFREAENYVPNRILAGTRNHSRASLKLTHLKRLTAQQRAHFDMKKGFAASGGILPEQQPLYSNLGMRATQELRGGFGSDLLRRLEEESATLTERDFDGLGTGVVPELRGLLDKLASVI